MRFDITRLFLWGYARGRVYADKASTLEHFKTNIRQVMAEISPNMCQKVIENYLKKSMLAIHRVGGHLNDVVQFTHNVNVKTYTCFIYVYF